MGTIEAASTGVDYAIVQGTKQVDERFRPGIEQRQVSDDGARTYVLRLHSGLLG